MTKLKIEKFAPDARPGLPIYNVTHYKTVKDFDGNDAVVPEKTERTSLKELGFKKQALQELMDLTDEIIAAIQKSEKPEAT